ncbi:palmitoyltransferase [Blastocystis sp. subtype 4]|uniref:palmitoyltransferase n=1 Tax=Blastocystis sp. subtype 4 TaxID=944170 RepID=UPI000711CCB6|nr:palmitoyltransferase [Blastocystis sp. subtype 4]KNB45923.1 palmitoyltransferase [Blastocystis sp. subtype 4]|eukprot:XP_014529366.1 palmitoyltransferase [Blastocystis sp. subtype 4]
MAHKDLKFVLMVFPYLFMYVCALIIAINKNKYNIVKYFVESGSTVRCMNNLKQTPIMIASKVGNINIVSICLKYGARVDDRDSKGMTPIHYSCLSGQIGVISFLKHHGASLDVRDNKGRTPLMIAAQENQLIVILHSYSDLGIQLVDKAWRTIVEEEQYFIGPVSKVQQQLRNKYGPQLAHTVDFAIQTPLEYSKELLAIPNNPHIQSIEATYALLNKFSHHRIRYEIEDLIDRYLAFLFVPLLSIVALILLSEVGLFSGIVSASVLETFFILAVITLLLWVYLCGSDPGSVLDGHQNLKHYWFLNADLKHSYEEIMDGTRLMTHTICPTCEIERPNRCKHCLKCDDCIYRMDHHCRWINNCIGISNHRVFYLFLTSCVVLLLYGVYTKVFVVQIPKITAIL